MTWHGSPKTNVAPPVACARLARWFAYHPWRTILGWVAIIVVLVGLVATVGGSLKDEFDIPGSDTQKATDLIESEFASEQGGVLNVVFAAPVGERLDTPQRKAAIEAAVAKARTEFAPHVGHAGGRQGRRWRTSRIRSIPTRSRRTGASPTPRRSSTRRSRTRTATRS